MDQTEWEALPASARRELLDSGDENTEPVLSDVAMDAADQEAWEKLPAGRRARIMGSPDDAPVPDAAHDMFDDIHDDQETWERMTPGQRARQM